MAVIGLDLGGTKISSGFVSGEGGIRCYNKILFHGATGNKVFEVLKERIRMVCREVEDTGDKVTSAGISVPGIYYKTTGHVWAPNIPGWDDFPLMEKLQESFGEIRFFIDNDRACYILGEVWKGKAQGCRDVIFIAVGTGLAAGIMVNGEVLNGSNGIAGAIGWMALNKPYEEKYKSMGCNEYYASGEGIARYVREVIASKPDYSGAFVTGTPVTSLHIIQEYERGDEVAVAVMKNTIACWGMSVANLVSIFNPEKIIFGGGVFSNSACKFLEDIHAEAKDRLEACLKVYKDRVAGV